MAYLASLGIFGVAAVAFLAIGLAIAFVQIALGLLALLLMGIGRGLGAMLKKVEPQQQQEI